MHWTSFWIKIGNIWIFSLNVSRFKLLMFFKMKIQKLHPPKEDYSESKEDSSEY